MKLREYQERAVANTIQAIRERKKSGLIVMPTGTGKTVVFSHIAKLLADHKRKTLVLAHRNELITQAHNAMQKIGLWSSIEMAENKADAMSDVVCASVQTMNFRVNKFAPDHFELIVIDEAHHTPAGSYQNVIDHFQNRYTLGVTATPDRLDGAALGEIFEEVLFQYTIKDAINDGWLVPIKQKKVVINGLDFSKIRTVAGDFNQGQLSGVMSEQETVIGVAAATVEQAEDRSTIVFAVTVAHAHELAKAIRDRTQARVEVVSGDTPKEERVCIVRDFQNGDIQFLVNCMVFTEGFDAPIASCVSMARPTKSRAIYVQAVGRGTRLNPGKEDLLILDFAGNAGKHSLMSVGNALAGDENAEIVDRAEQLMQGDTRLSLHEAIDMANQLTAEERRELMLARAQACVDYRTQEIDPFSLLGAASTSAWWSQDPITEKQKEILEQNGIDCDGLDKGGATGLIGKLFKRREDGLCSYKQAKLLAKKGLNPDMTFDQAKTVIDALSRNRWKVTEEVLQHAQG